jgi:MFS-type transporter involved in bile tolerance (Atg22 family)
MSRTSLTNCLIVVVLFGWVGSLVIGWLDRTYKMPGTVELAMASVVGYLLGQRFLQSGGPTPPSGQQGTDSQTKRKRWYERR